MQATAAGHLVVLGLSAFYHDSAAAIVIDGRVVAAAQEERFTRIKGDAAFPGHAVRYCLDEAGLDFARVDRIAFYDKPLLTFDRLLETYLAFAPRGFRSFATSMPVWLKQKLFLRSVLLDELGRLGFDKGRGEDLLFGFHHESHAASAFYPSPFESAAVLVVDGVGEWATTSIGRGRGRELELLSEVRFPHSLGLLYSAFTYHLGFKVNDGEYKVMGLAPYGEPRFADRLYERVIDLRDDGSYRLNLDLFDYCVGLTMTNGRFTEAFDGIGRRDPAEPLQQVHMDMARSLQVVLEEALLRLARTAHRETGERHLCMAGGVALNCVANGRILREGPFDDIWIQPASGDAGGALGVALCVHHALGGDRPAPGSRRVGATGSRRMKNGGNGAGDADTGRPDATVTPAHVTADGANGGGDGMAGALLGPAYDAAAIHSALDGYGARYDDIEDDDDLIATVVDALVSEKIVGWFQGRMEFGPRALGNRSILADARSPRMQRALNLKIKYREGFRPFAPAVLREDVDTWFELDHDSPYMVLVAPVRPDRRRALSNEDAVRDGLAKLDVVRSDIPAVTHVDYSARVQTVHAGTNPRLYRLLAALRQRCGCSVLVNTSFNIRDEPIVCSPADAYRCFMGTEMDMLVLGNTVLRKDRQ